MFKRYVFPTAQLGFAFAYNGFLCRCQHILRIHQLLGLNDNCALDPLHLDKIAGLQSQGLKDVLRDHDLAALTDLTNGHNTTPSLFGYEAHIHTIRLSDEKGLSSQAAVTGWSLGQNIETPYFPDVYGPICDLTSPCISARYGPY